MRSWSAFWVLPVLLIACGSADDLKLTARTSDEALEITDNAFGSAVSGRFRLELVLGSEVSGSTEVTAGTFELQTEAGELLADLGQASPEPTFPVNLNKGETKAVVFTIVNIDVDRAKACPGPVRIVGSVMDSSKGGTVPVRSAAITPDCGENP